MENVEKVLAVRYAIEDRRKVVFREISRKTGDVRKISVRLNKLLKEYMKGAEIDQRIVVSLARARETLKEKVKVENRDLYEEYKALSMAIRKIDEKLRRAVENVPLSEGDIEAVLSSL